MCNAHSRNIHTATLPPNTPQPFPPPAGEHSPDSVPESSFLRGETGKHCLVYGNVMIPLPSLVISSSVCMWPSSGPREIKRNPMRGPLEKVCSLLNNTGSLFPSAGCCHVCSGMTRTAVASRGYDSNNIAKGQRPPPTLHQSWSVWSTEMADGMSYGISGYGRRCGSHLELSLSLGSLTLGKASRHVPRTPWRGSHGKELRPEEPSERPWKWILEPQNSSPGHQLNSWLQTHEWPWARTTQLATPRFQTCRKYDLIVFLLLSC